MNEFLHDWHPHFWRSAVSQKVVGYRECTNCRRTEWIDGRVEPGTMEEWECQDQLRLLWRRPLFIQPVLFEFP